MQKAPTRRASYRQHRLQMDGLRVLLRCSWRGMCPTTRQGVKRFTSIVRPSWISNNKPSMLTASPSAILRGLLRIT